MTEQVRPSRLSNLLVVVLALASVVLVAASVLGDLDDQQRLTIFYVDCGICALFVAEFAWSWRDARWSRRFLLRNWYDVLGMVPVAHPAFIDGGWTAALWVVVVLARIGRAADRLVGERVTAALTQRATTALVDTIRLPVTVAVLDDVAEVLRGGHYARNLAAALDENHDELTSMIREKLEEDRLTGRVTLVPFHENLIDTISETTLRVVLAVLADPRTDELVADVLRENLDQLREQVRAKAHGVEPVTTPTMTEQRTDIPLLPPRLPPRRTGTSQR
jgi:voltage-gated potassium channel